MTNRRAWFAILCLILCVLPFTPGLNGPFLLDDQVNLQRARVVTGSSQEWVDIAIRNDSGPLKRPLSNLSFAAGRRFFGEEPFSFKVINLAIHLLVAFAIWRLALLVTGYLYPSLPRRVQSQVGILAAVFWTLHPMQVSTVLYTVQRMTQISALFVTLALVWTLSWFQRAPGIDRKGASGAAVIAWCFVILGLMGKENAILFPAYMLAIYLACGERRLMFRDTPGHRWMSILCIWAPLTMALVALPWVVAWAQKGFAIRDYSITERLLTEPSVLLHYLSTILVPDIRNMGLYLDDIPIQHINDFVGWAGVALIAAATVAAVMMRARAPALSFAVLWFIAGHALESSFLPLEIAFEHRNYLPLFGPALAAAYYLHKLAMRSRFIYFRSVLLLVPAVLATTTTVRSAQWSSPERFIVHEVANHPDSPRAQTDAAAFDSARGDFASSLRRIALVQRLRPHSFWYRVTDIQVACDIPGHPVDWSATLDALQRNPHQIGADEALMQVAGRFLLGSCPHVSPAQFERFLHSALGVVTVADLPERRERFMVLISWLRSAQGDSSDAERWLYRAAAANPAGTLALQRIAYDSLNANRLDEAQQAIVEMQDRLDQFGAGTTFELRELQSYLREARSTPTAREAHR